MINIADYCVFAVYFEFGGGRFIWGVGQAVCLLVLRSKALVVTTWVEHAALGAG